MSGTFAGTFKKGERFEQRAKAQRSTFLLIFMTCKNHHVQGEKKEGLKALSRFSTRYKGVVADALTNALRMDVGMHCIQTCDSCGRRQRAGRKGKGAQSPKKGRDSMTDSCVTHTCTHMVPPAPQCLPDHVS